MALTCTVDGCDRDQHALTFCFLHYRRQWRHGSPYDPRPSTEERFWAKVDKSGAGGCWLWTAAIDSGGYGSFWDGERVVKAHRWAWQYARGPVPDGMQLDHVRARGCRHRHCVNPAHLEPVTQRVNILRGSGMGARHATRTHCSEGHPLETDRKTGRRRCPICVRARVREATRRYRERKRAG